MKRKKKVPIVVNNKLKGDFGATSYKGKGFNHPTKIEVNLKAHGKDRAELASTIKHELMHVKHPKMTEKQVYKMTAKTKIPEQEQSKLIAKLRHKGLNYKMGAAKRKFKLGKVEMKPGELITNYNSQKVARTKGGLPNRPTERTAIMGAV